MFLSLCFLISLLYLVSLLSFKSIFLARHSGSMPYECGFLGVSNTKVSYSAEFYLVVFCFMFFDLEIILVMPFLVSNVFFSYMFIFVLIVLTLILCYEILKGTFKLFFV